MTQIKWSDPFRMYFVIFILWSFQYVLLWNKAIFNPSWLHIFGGINTNSLLEGPLEIVIVSTFQHSQTEENFPFSSINICVKLKSIAWYSCVENTALIWFSWEEACHWCYITVNYPFDLIAQNCISYFLFLLFFLFLFFLPFITI